MSQRDPNVTARRNLVCGLREDVMTSTQISRTLGVSLGCVSSDIQNLRAEGRLDDRTKPPLDWETIQTHWNHGFSVRDLARIFNASEDTIRHLMQRMRDRGVEFWPERDPRRCGHEPTAGDGEAAA